MAWYLLFFVLKTKRCACISYHIMRNSSDIVEILMACLITNILETLAYYPENVAVTLPKPIMT